MPLTTEAPALKTPQLFSLFFFFFLPCQNKVSLAINKSIIHTCKSVIGLQVTTSDWWQPVIGLQVWMTDLSNDDMHGKLGCIWDKLC